MMAENRVLKVAESNHNDSDVVQRSPQQTVFDYVLNSHTAHLMDIFSFAFH